MRLRYNLTAEGNVCRQCLSVAMSVKVTDTPGILLLKKVQSNLGAIVKGSDKARSSFKN